MTKVRKWVATSSALGPTEAFVEVEQHDDGTLGAILSIEKCLLKGDPVDTQHCWNLENWQEVDGDGQP